MTDYLRDRSHLLLAGVTGARTDYGGKTGLANWWASTWGREHFDVCIFFNSKADSAPEQHAEAVVESVDGVARAIEAGAGHICLTPSTADWGAVHERLYELVDWLPDDMEKAVIHDEAPEYDEDALRSFVRVAGNGSRCKSVVIAQAPGDLSMAVRRQCILVWVGPVSEDNRHVFRANKREAHFEWMLENHAPYQWSIMLGPDPDDRDTYAPVPETYA